MPQSPNTPHKRRRSSNFGSPLTPIVSQTNPPSQRRTHSRKSSVQSTRSPTTPRPPSAQGSFPGDFAEQTVDGQGLGSLADELAEEEWFEDEEIEGGFIDKLGGDATEENEHTPPRNTPNPAAQRGLSVGTSLGDSTNSKKTDGWRSKHRPKPSEYDGSDYGPSDEFEDTESIPPSLESRFSDIEGLVRQDGSGSRLGCMDGTIARVSEQLKELGSQANVETHIARLSTAYTALTTHMAHQSRTLASLTYPITTPLGGLLDPETAEELLALLEAFISSLPYPHYAALPPINALHTNTDDLLSTLSMLADSLQESRSTSNTASRQVKTAREMTVTLKREFDEAEEARVWLERGNWETKLQRREAAAECRDVCAGFEQVCEGWRRRLEDSERNGMEAVIG